jgi:hypothetical protein
MPRAFDGHGLSDDNRAMVGKVQQGRRALYRAGKRAGKGGNNRNRKADFENQAKLMEYGANLQDWGKTQDSARQDWHQSRLPGHLDAAMESMQNHLDPDVARESASYQYGDAKVSLSGSLRRPVKEGKSEENPHGQGQQMKELAGPRKVFLGVYKPKEDKNKPGKQYPLANIPTLTSENSGTDENGHINFVGRTRYNFGRRQFESNVENSDAYQNQQDKQDQQADDSHNQGQQMRGIF